MSKETLIFVKGDENFEVPEKCEGIFYPVKFNSKEYIDWKTELDQNVRDEILLRNHKDEVSLYNEIFNVFNKNFVSAQDREYMLLTRFLVDPRDMDGVIDTTAEYGDANGKIIYPPIRDDKARFNQDNAEYRELYQNFMTVLRHCLYKNPVLAPKEVYEAVIKDKETEKNEYNLSFDTLPRDSWEILSKWLVVRNFIENTRKTYPPIEKLLTVYGEPNCTCLDTNFVAHDGEYVDIVDSNNSSLIVSALIEKFGIDNVKHFALPG
jgi:hypothetical protein